MKTKLVLKKKNYLYTSDIQITSTPTPPESNQLNSGFQDRENGCFAVIFRKFESVFLLFLLFLAPFMIVNAQNPDYRPRINNLNGTAQQILADQLAIFTTENIIEQHDCPPIHHHAHSNKYLLPWHRAYVESFEDWMHKKNIPSNAAFQMPGWDPTEVLPAAFFVLDPACSEVECANAAGNCDELVSDDPNISLPDYTGQTSLTTLGGFLQSYHEDVHDGVGGAFATYRSPAGLMFFPWHAYFDEIWQDWSCNYYVSSPIQERVDYYIKDSPHMFAADAGHGGLQRRLYDAGAEHDQSNFNYDTWISEYIWVRNTDDGFTNQQHQNILGSQTNYIYVKVRNNGCIASEEDVDELELRWSVGDLNLSNWPDDWNGVNDYQADPQLPMGGLVDVITMDQSIDIGKYIVYEFEWSAPNINAYIPNAFKYPNPKIGISFLARIISEEDPDLNDALDKTDPYVKENNNVARRKSLALPVIYKAVSTGTPNTDPATCCIIMENLDSNTHVSRLDIGVPEDEWGDHFFNHGYLFLTLDDSLYALWTAGGSQGYGITDMDNPIRIDAASAYLSNISLAGNDTWMVCAHAQIEDYIREDDDRKEFSIDVRHVITTQTDSLEGVRLYVDLKEPPSEELFQLPVSNKIKASHFILYPNPVNDVIQWVSSGSNPVDEVQILDINGRLNRVIPGLRGGSDVSDLLPGIYIVRATMDDGHTEVHRFVKQ